MDCKQTVNFSPIVVSTFRECGTQTWIHFQRKALLFVPHQEGDGVRSG
jgi:hypothetical protein